MKKEKLEFEELRNMANTGSPTIAGLALAKVIRTTNKGIQLLSIKAAVQILLNEDGSISTKPILAKTINNNDPIITEAKDMKDLVDKFNQMLDEELPDEEIAAQKLEKRE